MDTAVLTDTDARCGRRWLAGLDASGRLELLSVLLSRFNHDLRTPLNTILGWTHLLQKGGLDSDRVKHVAEVIARNSRDQTRLLEEFVDDARAVLGILQLQATVVAMDDLVTQAIERMAGALSLHGVSIQPKLCAAGVAVNGDPPRLERLIYRLLCILTRRSREASTVDIESQLDRARYVLSFSGRALEPEWSDAALLELRISTLVAELHQGELEVGADATRPCIQLTLPRL